MRWSMRLRVWGLYAVLVLWMPILAGVGVTRWALGGRAILDRYTLRLTAYGLAAWLAVGLLLARFVA
jgi:hypothetical protein